MDDLFYEIALSRVEWIGPKLARVLLSKFETPENIFKATDKDLNELDGFGKFRIKALKKEIDKSRIKEEIDFIQRNKLQPIFLTHEEYPKPLRNCPDAPIMLFYKGNYDLRERKIVSIVGTRANTDYGRQMAEELVADLKGQNIMIVSGLAAGIDSIAHKAAVKNKLPTVAVLGHGLDMIYPAKNRTLAKEMIGNGGLLTEYPSKTKPDKQNFPRRNRIVAGMAHVTVVVETKERGGSMITAKLAASYNREVAAFPGRTIDTHSNGCNYLIRTNIAHLISNANDLLELMGWEKKDRKKVVAQRKLFQTLNEEEQSVVNALDSAKETHIDVLTLKTKISNSKIASILLSLEMEGLVRSLPGKRYRLS